MKRLNEKLQLHQISIEEKLKLNKQTQTLNGDERMDFDEFTTYLNNKYEIEEGDALRIIRTSEDHIVNSYRDPAFKPRLLSYRKYTFDVFTAKEGEWEKQNILKIGDKILNKDKSLMNWLDDNLFTVYDQFGLRVYYLSYNGVDDDFDLLYIIDDDIKTVETIQIYALK